MADSSNYRDRPSVTISDPRTGRPLERNVQAPGSMDINPQFIQQLFETQKMDDAEKALSAAIQFQGLRGYQQALQKGEAAEKAMTRFGPMMFYQRPTAVGSAIKSVTPQVISPYQREVLDERVRMNNRDRIIQGPQGRISALNPTNNEIRELQAANPNSGRPEKFSAVVDFDRMRNPIRLPVTGEQFQRFMETAPPKLQTNSVNTTISRMLQSPTASTNAAPRVRRWNRQAGKFE